MVLCYPNGMERRSIQVPYALCYRCGYNGVYLRTANFDVSEIRHILTTTSVPSERNAAALDLVDTSTIDDLPDLLDALVRLIRDPNTRGDRGTLIYALGSTQVMLMPAVITDMLLDNSGEPFYEALELLHAGLFVEDEQDIIAQIKRIESYLLAQRGTPDDPDKYEGMRDAHFIFVEKIAKPIQLPVATKFVHKPWPIAVVQVAITALSSRLGYRLDQWTDENTQGFAVILPTNLWVRVRDEPGYAPRDAVVIEAVTEPVDNVNALLREALDAFGMGSDLVLTKRIGQTECWT